MKYNFEFRKTDKIKSSNQALYVPGSKLEEFEHPSVEIPFSCKGSIIMRHGRGTKMKLQLEGMPKREFIFSHAVKEVTLDKLDPREYLALKCAVISMLQDTFSAKSFAYSILKAETVLKKLPAGFLKDAEINSEYKSLMSRLVASKSTKTINKSKVDDVKRVTGGYQYKLDTKYYNPRIESLDTLKRARDEMKTYDYQEFVQEQEQAKAQKERYVNEEYSRQDPHVL